MITNLPDGVKLWVPHGDTLSDLDLGRVVVSLKSDGAWRIYHYLTWLWQHGRPIYSKRMSQKKFEEHMESIYREIPACDLNYALGMQTEDASLKGELK